MRPCGKLYDPKLLATSVELISMPNVSADQENARTNAEFIAKEFEKRGAQMQFLEVQAANPVVYGEIPVLGAQ